MKMYIINEAILKELTSDEEEAYNNPEYDGGRISMDGNWYLTPEEAEQPLAQALARMRDLSAKKDTRSAEQKYNDNVKKYGINKAIDDTINDLAAKLNITDNSILSHKASQDSIAAADAKADKQNKQLQKHLDVAAAKKEKSDAEAKLKDARRAEFDNSELGKKLKTGSEKITNKFNEISDNVTKARVDNLKKKAAAKNAQADTIRKKNAGEASQSVATKTPSEGKQ